jgi:hypothetical protein
MRGRTRSRGSVVGIATGYGLDDRRVGVRVPVGSIIFSSPCRPDWLWGPQPISYPMGNGGSFPGSKAAGAWNWTLTSSQGRDQENMDLYNHSPILLNGLVLNSLSTETSLPFYLCGRKNDTMYWETKNCTNIFFLFGWILDFLTTLIRGTR